MKKVTVELANIGKPKEILYGNLSIVRGIRNLAYDKESYHFYHENNGKLLYYQRICSLKMSRIETAFFILKSGRKMVFIVRKK